MASSPVTRSSFSNVDFPRAGGILLNGEAPITPTTPSFGAARGRPVAITIARSTSSQGSPTDNTFRANSNSPPQTTGDLGGASPRIRFAPLPDPHRPRSLSTGRNVGFRVAEGENGEREYSLELRGMDDGDEHALDSDDDDSDGSAGGGYDDNGRRRSWVSMGGVGSKMTMGMNMGSMGSWMGMGGSKKGKKEDSAPSNAGFGAPLKKSVSSGGIPSSQKLAPEKKGGSSLLGTSPGSSLFGSFSMGGSTSGSHRRGGSGDASASLSTSAPKVRMLNGRVYGARRASEAAAAEEMRRRRMEPEFVEWGSGSQGGVGSNPSPAARTKTVDDDDGGGMAWVRKRREERERKEREERERREAEEAAAAEGGDADGGDDDNNGRPASLSSSASSSSGARGLGPGPLTPHEPPAELVAFPPAIQVIPPARTPPASDMPKTPMPRLGDDSPAGENDHVVHAISIPGGGGDRLRPKQHNRADSDDFEYEDDGEGDGDFEDDEDEEEPLEGVGRFTSSAAGVEILSRHK